MKAVKYLFALWAGVLVYASLSVIFGIMGFSAYRQLQAEEKKQEANIENLKQINRELESVMNSLLYDKDTLAVYARDQGYASAQERFVRIVGLGVNRNIKTAPGELVAAASPQYVPGNTIMIIAFCSALTMIFCMAVFDIMRILRER